MSKSIFITGISGSGKTAVAEELSRRKYIAYSIEDIPNLFKMVDKITKKVIKDHDNYNLKACKQHDWICNKNKLQKLINKDKNGLAFYCGIPSNLDEIFPLFDKVFLLKVSPNVMCHRLSTRTSNDFGRTPEAQKWILSWKNWLEGRIQKKGAIVINADRGLKIVVDDIIKKSKNIC